MAAALYLWAFIKRCTTASIVSDYYYLHADCRNLDAHQKLTVDVVGPICETGDFLAQDRGLPEVKNNDLLVVMSTGAYGFTMSSNYCSRLRVAEVMVNGDRFDIIRKRQDYIDLIADESLPPYLA